MLKIKSFCLIILIINFNFGDFQATATKTENSNESVDDLNLQNEDKKSSLKSTLNQIIQLFEKKLEIQNQEIKELNENVLKLQQQLSDYKSNINEKQTETEAAEENDLKNYDKHFNCLKNCTTRINLPKSCHDAVYNYYGRSGVYLIRIPNSELQPFYVYCRYETGIYSTVWTIIQRRTDNTENFYRSWFDYKYGFGNLYNEYWLGLERIHQMTKNQKHELWILLENFDDEQRFAKYAQFNISNEANKYQLNVGGYSGNAGDSLTYSNKQKFSTFDHDNDVVYINCAFQEKAGWWHQWCTEANLNGPYYSYANRRTPHGIYWYKWSGFRDSMKYVHMAIRSLE